MRFDLLLALVALSALGCTGTDEKVVPQPVSGQVIYDGQPAAGVEVTLIPTDAPMVPRIPRNPRGVTGPDGKFKISTFTDGDGAAEGGYQVVMSWPVPEQAAEGESSEQMDTDQFMGWYDGTRSTLNVRIKAGANDLPAWKLPKVVKPPPVSEGVPGRN